ncbi:MAG: hypothetical protein WA082_02270 [Candidatus Moraniibacteriota bacterium]
MKKITEFTKKYEKGILFTVFLFGIVSIFWTFLASFGLGESGYNFLGKTKKVTLAPGAPVTQTFTAHENNLSQVRFVMGNVVLQNNDFLEFRLLDEACSGTIAVKKFDTKPNEQGAYTIFAFTPVVNSKERTYCFSATYFSDEDRKGDKPYLSATTVPELIFSDRTLTDTNKNKVYPSQTLFLRPAYTSGSLLGDLSNLVNRLSQYKPEFLKGWSIAVLFMILVIGSIALGYHLMFTREKE